MPLVTAAVIVYAAGLLAGFGESPLWCGGVALFVAMPGRGRREIIALLGLTVAAYAAADRARQAQDSCVERLRRSRAWSLVLTADAAPGAFVAARSTCGALVRLAVRDGRAAGGATVAASGTLTSSSDMLLVQDARLEEIRTPGAVARWRGGLARGLDAAFGTDAPLVRTLLLADTRDLSPTVRNRFAAAGLSHMLSVSGLHVGIIAAAVAVVAQLLGAPAGRRDLAVLLLTAGYVGVIGAPLPAVRSAVMLGVASAAYALQRPTSPWAILAVGAAAPLADPRAILDVGYRLSVAGMVALIAAGALHRRWHWLAAPGWRGTLYRALATSTAATLLTAPLVASTFGRVSFVAPVSNLAAVPIIGVLQPMLFLAAIAVAAGTGAAFVAGAAHPLLVALDAVASLAARLPGSSVAVASDGLTTALACAAAAAFVVAAVSRFPGRALVAGAACIAAIAWRPALPLGSGMTELHMIDVGQGDAIALRTARGRWVLFDAGRDWVGGNEGTRDVIPYLNARGGPLVAFVLSHPHSDHVGGAASTLRALRPSLYYDPGYAGASAPYRASLVEASRLRTRWARVHPGDSLVVDEAVITFLAPDSVWAESQRDPNLASAVVRVRVGDVRMLLTGDAEAGEEDWLLERDPALLRADVLKVAHHGSRTSSTEPFVAAVSPRLALISVGAGNVYHHPSESVLRTLAAHRAVTLRTDLAGTVVVRTDGHAIDVEAGGERWPLRP